MWRCDNMVGLGTHVTCHLFRFISIPFKFFCFILQLAPSPHQWTDFDNLYVTRKEVPVPLGVSIIALPIWVSNPQKQLF